MVMRAPPLLLLLLVSCCCGQVWTVLSQLKTDVLESLQFQSVTDPMDGVSSLEFCLTESKSLKMFFIPAIPRVPVFLGQKVNLGQYVKGKLVISDATPLMSRRTTFSLQNWDRKTIRNLSLASLEGSLGASISDSAGQILGFMFNDSTDSMSRLLNIATTTLCLALPERGSKSHYRNEVEYVHSEHSPYSTFLSAIPKAESRVTSLVDIISAHLPARRVIFSSSMVVYFNRFVVELELAQDEEASVSSEGDEYGFISSVVYGERFPLEMTINVTLPGDVRVTNFAQSLQSVLQLNSSTSIDSEMFLGAQMNVTTQFRGEQKTLVECDIRDVVKLISSWKEEILANRSFLDSVPIAVEVSRFGPHTHPVRFHFTQCVTTTLPPIQILMLLSNILLIGTMLGLVVSVCFFSMCCYVLVGVMISRLLEVGRIALPSFVRVVPFEIPLVYIWPPNDHHQHQD